ncbi:dihydroorotase [Chloracidobacterium sp. MS 40/45]|uniref:dihydroorotase n=1 Tax=Chloracidobacterium aggregatum TaxID=2851959 RepID=UPI001B8D5ADD|nr:dihydroorotase [Chloracidobacterium aggregatum]QUV99303.1 dihydroorotase [Chloracidobacterium sp. MS 40/45]
MALVIRNGRVCDPSQNLDAVMDVLVVEGRIAALGPNLDIPPQAELVDATGLVVAPGFIDVHVHLREPGFTAKETIATGTRAAVAGGFTAVCCMANTSPVNDSPLVTRYILDRAQEAAACRVYPIGAVTRGLQGEALADIGGMAAAGVVALSDDGHGIANANLLRRALEYASDFGLPVIDHCENRDLAAGGVINEGAVSTRLGVRGMTRAAEEADVARDVVLSSLTGAHIHIAHLSTAGSLELVRRARAEGLPITCEVTPHHLVLDESAVLTLGALAKMNPPLRTAGDVEALLEGVADGTVTCLATDHAPHTTLEKDQVLLHAPFGVVGLECAVSLMLDRLHWRQGVPLLRLIELFSTGPARTFNLPGGTLQIGCPADMTILDIHRETVVDVRQWQSKARNCPFDGWRLRGAPVMVVVGGERRSVQPTPPVPAETVAAGPRTS